MHLGLAAIVLMAASGPHNESVEVVILEVKGDSKNLAVTAVPKTLIQRKTVRAPVPVLQKSSDEQTPPVKMAEVDETPAEQSGEGRFGSVNGMEVSAQERYKAELRAMLERRKEYPVLAKRLRQQGRVLVQFTLRRDGSVMRAEVIETSEFETLNKAAARLISGIDGLKPFPEEVKRNEWVFVLPVEYRM